MSLHQWNATVSTSTTTNTPVVKLSRVRAYITPPKDRDMLQAGGIVRHVVLLDPGRDIARGDALVIETWGQHTGLTRRPYHVFDAEPEGGLDLEVLRCPIGEKVQR